MSLYLLHQQSDEINHNAKATAIALSTIQVRGLERLKRGQIYDCEDRTEIRKELKLPPAAPHSPGDCNAIAHAYNALIANARYTLHRITETGHQIGRAHV